MIGHPLGVHVEVRSVRGSAPREAGAAMRVTAEAAEGSLGGGALEYAAIHRARALLRAWRAAAPGDDASVLEIHALGPELGQCCGGSVTLAYRPCFEPALAKPTALFHLQLHGAGHVGRALVAILRALPCTIDWVDSRVDGFPETSVGETTTATIRRHYAPDPAGAVAAMPEAGFYLVMTHSHALDFEICEAILRRDDARYVGLIGSATKYVRFMRRWRANGISEAASARLTCPIGLPVIQGKHPSVIAVAVAAQLLALGQATERVRNETAEAGCTGCAARPVCATA